MPTEVRHSGAWRTLTGVEVKHSGAWRDVKTVEVKSGGVWREVYASGPAVSAVADGCTNFRSTGTVFGGAQFNSNGIEYEYTSTGGTTSKGNWLDSGLNSEVWVQFVRTGGLANWDVHPGTGRYQLSTTRSYYITRSAAGNETISGYFRFYDAASGGNLLQQTSTVNWTIEQGLA